jgi:hypothetical protein
MKKYIILLLAVMIGLSLATCNNATKPTSTAAGKTEPSKTENADATGDNNIISFKVNGSLVKTSGWNIAPFRIMDGVAGINVTSNMHEDARTVMLNINGDTTGTYSLVHGIKSATTRGIAYGSYHPDYLKEMKNNYQFESGEFVITSIDKTAHTLNGTFQGKAKNAKGEEVEITEGKVIKGKLKPMAKGLNN